MKNLFFVSVAVGIFSGTSISTKAQTAVTSVKFGTAQKKTFHFIEDIEIKREAKPAEEIDMWATPVKKTAIVEVSKITAKIVSNNSAATVENCSMLQFKYAQLMDMEVENFTNTKLYTAIDNWWATRYRYGGTTKKGIDCSALTGVLLSEGFGITTERTARAQYAQSTRVAKADLQEGDLVFFNTRGGISHAGLYLGNGYFVHASVHSGVTINSLNDNYYSKKYVGGGRMSKE